MRISDWSSDVCSSDLRAHRIPRARRTGTAAGQPSHRRSQLARYLADTRTGRGGGSHHGPPRIGATRAQGDRKSVVQGKSVSVRVDLGGRRNINEKTTDIKHAISTSEPQ